MDLELDKHRRFLNHYYGMTKHIYDLTRRFFLFGRDRALSELMASSWNGLIEIGPGTGRNLLKLHFARPDAKYGAVEASDEMLDMTRRRCPWAVSILGFAEEPDCVEKLDVRPERILFSYSLSMIKDKEAALCNAKRSLAPGGELIIVDFGDMLGLHIFAGIIKRVLSFFRVTPIDADLLISHGARICWGPCRYFMIAKITKAL